ncbi:MAG: serine hydrolase [Haliea sp.]
MTDPAGGRLVAMLRWTLLVLAALRADTVLAEDPPEGELQLQFGAADSFVIEVDRLGLGASFAGQVDRLPVLALELAADGSVLLPARRLPIPGPHPLWQAVAGEGVWERDARGKLTLQMPLDLLEQGANCIHYGELAVSLPADGDGSAVLQVSGQTCEYFKFSARFEGSASWRPVELAVEQSHSPRFPVYKLQQLRRDSGIDGSLLAPPAGVSHEHLTMAGLLLDGRHYQSACAVAAGPARRCEQLPLPTFSLSKSLVAGTALMRLERLAPGSRQRTIGELLPACDGNWGDVTLQQALNMQTGRYEATAYFEDEAAAIASPLFLAPDHAAKLAWACSAYPRREAAGGRWVYHTSDTYVLVSAMAMLLRELRGTESADLYSDLLFREAWAELQLGPLAAFTRRTADAAAQPFGGWGQLLTADDLLQLGLWLAEEARNPALLDPAMVRAAISPQGALPGVATGVVGLRYQHGFWLLDAAPALGCRNPYWIPFLSGHGGITLALLAENVLYYYVSDNNEFRWLAAVSAVHQQRPLCH